MKYLGKNITVQFNIKARTCPEVDIRIHALVFMHTVIKLFLCHSGIHPATHNITCKQQHICNTLKTVLKTLLL
jgi:hypothetical protein